MKKILLVVLFLYSNAFLSVCYSKDLGKIGTVYKITEKNLIDLIKEKAQEKINRGGLSSLNNKIKENALEYTEKPKGVILPRAKVHKATEITSIYTVPKDIYDENGKVLYKKGMEINPLKIHPLTKVLCFIDGDDKDQVSWLKKYCAVNPRNKLILVNGSFLKVSKELGVNVYFDQHSYLVNKLGLTALPSILREVKGKLYVEEIPLGK